MADRNAQDTGGFEYWITDRITFMQAPQKSGNTGDFEKWITDRIYFEDYLKQERAPRNPFYIYQVPAVV